MSEEYAKMAVDIIYSSMWEEDGETCKLWVTILALKDRNGNVTKNKVGIARIAKVTLEKCEAAFLKFESPDPHSSSQEHEGRRLLKLPEGGWFVVNHDKYHEYGWSEEKKRFERERKAKWRARKNLGAQAPLPLEANNEHYGSSGQIPTFDEIKDYGASHGVLYEAAKSFFDYYQGNRLWINKLGLLIDWRHMLPVWAERGKEFKGGKGAKARPESNERQEDIPLKKITIPVGDSSRPSNKPQPEKPPV